MLVSKKCSNLSDFWILYYTSLSSVMTYILFRYCNCLDLTCVPWFTGTAVGVDAILANPVGS